MNIEECFEKRLLRKIPLDNNKAKRSLELAKKSLRDAKYMREYEIFDMIILKSYMTMFHVSRALMYLDGIQEKSHYAIFVYLKEKYSDKIPGGILNYLNIHRIERHEAMYGLEFQPGKEDAKSAIEDAEIFLEEIKKVLSVRLDD